MSRYDELKRALEERRFFKVVCGAGNEDPEEVRKLTKVYTLAGATAIDISANTDIVTAARLGIDEAEEIAPRLQRRIAMRPGINVSVGIKGDPHVRKAEIVSGECTACGICRERCEQEAITDDFRVKTERCIGCGDCAGVCPASAIVFHDKRINLKEILPQCIARGTEMLELHAATDDDAGVLEDWRIVNALIPENFISMCLDRSLLSNQRLIRRINDAHAITGERLIIQADGVPMSGGSDDFNTTLQAIAIADIVNKSGIPVKILASGGTNSRTRELAALCGVDIHGVAIGTFSRKIIRPLIESADFDGNIARLEQAVTLAEELVRRNIRPGGDTQ